MPSSSRRFALAASVAFIAAAFPVTAAAAATNVLLIVVDDLNTMLGCYGDPVVKSPNIDRLAARGVRFERASCQYPLCNPSRVSFLTGLRPETTGVYRLNLPARVAAPEAVTLPQFFRQSGYFTAGAGKVFHNAQGSDPASWDSYQDRETEDPEEKAALNARYAGGDGRPASRVLSTDGAKTRDGVNATRITDLIQERTATGKPFFLAAGFHKPHLPWTAPRRFFDLYPAGAIKTPVEPAMKGVPSVALQTELSGFPQPDSRTEAMRGYFACISFTDYQIGRLLDQLDRLRLWDNTIVVLLGDNGFHLGDHGGLWAKLSAFDASTRVPLIIVGPGMPKNAVVTDPVELIDVYPTVVDLAGFSRVRSLPGRSLVALANGKAAAQARPSFSIVYHYDPEHRRDVMGRSVIGANYRYTEWDGGAAREFYLRTADPGEYVNRIDSPEVGTLQHAAETILRAQPTPKPGPANRPRALTKPEDRVQ